MAKRVRKSFKKVLSELKERALEAASDGITISDPTLPDNPLIYVNSGFETITGYRKEEVIGRNCRFLQGPQTSPLAAEEIRQAIAQQRPCVVEILNYRKDGSPFWNRLSITPVRDSNGQLTHFIGILSDITNRKKTEDLLRAVNSQLEKVNQQMRQALHYAGQIQRTMLPTNKLEGNRFRVAGRLQTSDELAGDMFNYFVLPDGKVGFYVLDVVGHGVSAALLSVSVSRLMSPRSSKSFLFAPVENPTSRASRVLTPAAVANVLNELFIENADSGIFFTLFYGVWDPISGVLSYVSAGHPPALYVPKSGPIQILSAAGFPIGIMPTPEYTNMTLPMHSGDRLIVFSDGLVEQWVAPDKQLGIDGLMQIIDSTRHLPLEQCLEETMRQTDALASAEKIKDDRTLLAFEVK